MYVIITQNHRNMRILCNVEQIYDTKIRRAVMHPDTAIQMVRSRIEAAAAVRTAKAKK